MAPPGLSQICAADARSDIASARNSHATTMECALNMQFTHVPFFFHMISPANIHTAAPRAHYIASG